MKPLYLPVKEAVDTLVQSVIDDKETMIVCHADTKVIGHGRNESFFDKQYCIDNNIILLNANFDGGACVVFEDDVNVICYQYGFSDIGMRAMNIVNDYLKEKGLNSDVIGNDLIITEGETLYKVGSFASVWVNNDHGVETVIHFALNIDDELIRRICKKEVNKIPKSLSDYGITSKEILEVLENNLKELSK